MDKHIFVNGFAEEMTILMSELVSRKVETWGGGADIR